MYPGAEARRAARAAVETWRRARADVAGPMDLAGLARHAAALADALTGLAESDAAAEGRPATCGRGCAACCREVVPVSPAEACLLAEWLEAAPWDRREEIGEAFRRADAVLRDAGLSGEPLLDRASAYFALSIPCPFLAGEECSAHAARPSACRGHLVSSPAADCREFPSPSIRPLAVAGDAGEALSEVVGELLGGREMIPLARLPGWLAAQGDLRGRVWDGAALLDRLSRACLFRLVPPGNESGLPSSRGLSSGA